MVAAHRPAARRRADEPNPELHLVVVVPRHPDVDGRFALPPNEVGRLEAIRVVREGRTGPRARVRPGERTPAHRSTCTRRSASSTTCGRARAAPTSTGARGATTASCRARSWTTRGTTREPRDPAGLGDGARRFARDLRLDADARAPRPRPTATTRTCSTRTTRWPAVDRGGRRARRLAPRRPGRPAAARDGCARTAPRSCRAWTRVWARAGSTGSSTTRTAGRCRDRLRPALVTDRGSAPLLRGGPQDCVSAVTWPPAAPPAARPPSRRPR